MSDKEIIDVYHVQQELEQAKKNLLEINENIVRLTGRRFRDVHSKRVQNTNSRRNESRGRHRDETLTTLNSPSVKRIQNGRLQKPRLCSHVIYEAPSKDKVVEAQGVDSISKERNRRIFGSLMGTLQKFTQEETRLKRKEAMKAQIEKKLEEQELSERETIRKEREVMFHNKKTKQGLVKKLEEKLNRLNDFQLWEQSQMALKRQLKTRAKPPVYFRPRIISGKIKELLNENAKTVNSVITDRKIALEQELSCLEKESYMDMNKPPWGDYLHCEQSPKEFYPSKPPDDDHKIEPTRKKTKSEGSA